MELKDLKVLIDSALEACQRKLNKQPEIVLSETDLERLVSWSILKMLGQNNYKKPQLSDLNVHTEYWLEIGAALMLSKKAQINVATDLSLQFPQRYYNLSVGLAWQIN